VTRKALVLFVAMSVIWGVPYLFIKIAVASISPASLVFLRTGFGMVLLLPVAAFRREIRPVLPAWRWIAVYTAAEIAGPWLFLSTAEQHLSSSLSGLLIAAVPLIGALLARLTGSEHQMDGRRVAGLVVGLGGVAALVGLNISSSNLTSVVEVGLCTIGYAVGPMIIARRLSHLPPVGVVAASLALSAVAYGPLGVAQLLGGAPTARALAAAATLGVVCTAVAFVLFFALIAEIGPVRATVITYFNPAVALVLGVTVLGEPLRAGTVAGFALILAGSSMATRRPAAGRAAAEPRGAAGTGG
jgi:drug/metabolite transporter (DMT)-like permease